MRTVVLGTGRSGLAVTRYLLEKGGEVIVSDLRGRADVEQTPYWSSFLELESDFPGRLDWALGGHPLELLDRCEQIVVSPGVSLHVPFLAAALARGVRVSGEMELAFSASPQPLIAVTGTNGKSTTCSVLGEMLGDRGVVGGNIGTPLLDQVRNLPPGVEWVVAEVSSFQLETVHTFRPAIGVLTNITPDHLDHHKDLEEYEAAKSRLFAQMGPDCTAVFCQDDPNAMKIEGYLRDGSLPAWVDGFPKPASGAPPKIRTYSVSGPVTDGVGLTIDPEGRTWVTRYVSEKPEKLFPWDFPALPGKAMMSNGLAAVTAALEAGLSLDDIQSALRTFQPLHYRMERVGVVDGVTYINDSKATNIDSALAAVGAVIGPLAVIVGGKDKGVDYSSLADGLRARNGRIFLIGEAAEPIEEKLREIGFENFERSGTLERALVAATASLSEGGGTVLLAPACSSFDQFTSAEHRGQVFNDLVADLQKTRSGKS